MEIYIYQKKELRNIIEFLTKMRNINDYKSKSSDRLHEIFKKQSKNKERIDNIRENFKKLRYKLSKSELKEIKTDLYNIEKRKKISLKKTNKYLNELDKKIDKLEKYHDYDDDKYKGIKDIKDLFKLSIDKDHYKPILVKSGYNNNYVQYKSKGDKILSIQEYLALIEKYLKRLINQYKKEGKWKMQLIAEINFISLKPGSHETRVMYTRSNNEEFMNGDDTNEIINHSLNHFYKDLKRICKKK